MAAAVSGLSPVIMTVLIPIERSSPKRSLIPPLTTSLSWMTPSARAPSATTSGVPPVLAMAVTAASTLAGTRPPACRTQLTIVSAAPFRIWRPSRSTPLIRVSAENGTKCAPSACTSRSRMPNFSLASTTMLRPSGVSSAREASCAASASSCSVTPSAGMKATAWRLPSVMVPVLSSRSTSTSPAASTARPDMAMTFFRIIRSMPAMPMAESSPPMVVGMRQTSSATSTVRVMGVPRPAAATLKIENGSSVATVEQEDQREPGQQDLERDLVGRLLAGAPPR